MCDLLDAVWLCGVCGAGYLCGCGLLILRYLRFHDLSFAIRPGPSLTMLQSGFFLCLFVCFFVLFCLFLCVSGKGSRPPLTRDDVLERRSVDAGNNNTLFNTI